MTGELEFFKELWSEWEDAEGRVFCMETGRQIEFSPWHCAHIISKGSHPAMRLDKRNVIPLCVEAHTLLDSGNGRKTRKDMKIWPFLERRIMLLKLEYAEKDRGEFIQKIKDSGIVERFGLIPEKD